MKTQVHALKTYQLWTRCPIWFLSKEWNQAVLSVFFPGLLNYWIFEIDNYWYELSELLKNAINTETIWHGNIKFVAKQYPRSAGKMCFLYSNYILHMTVNKYYVTDWIIQKTVMSLIWCKIISVGEAECNHLKKWYLCYWEFEPGNCMFQSIHGLSQSKMRFDRII